LPSGEIVGNIGVWARGKRVKAEVAKAYLKTNQAVLVISLKRGGEKRDLGKRRKTFAVRKSLNCGGPPIPRCHEEKSPPKGKKKKTPSSHASTCPSYDRSKKKGKDPTLLTLKNFSLCQKLFLLQFWGRRSCFWRGREGMPRARAGWNMVVQNGKRGPRSRPKKVPI